MNSASLYAIAAGLLFGVGVFLLLRRDIVRILLGIVLISHSVNIALFVAPELSSNQAPIIGETETLLRSSTADPLPQALILTAIVIGFGVLAFLLVLLLQTAKRFNSTDISDFGVRAEEDRLQGDKTSRIGVDLTRETLEQER